MAAIETQNTDDRDGGTREELPKDNLIRATFPGEIGVRDIGGDIKAMPTMTVGFARYGEWTHINSVFEGEFMERIAPGAFTKTIKENAANMRVLFEHGRDPQIGNKVLGPIAEVRDTPDGPVGEVPLLDTSYNRDLVPGLREGVYGSSFRFKVMKEDLNRDAKSSDYNPDGLPERTILEAQVREFGPVTFPAYSGATAGVRSLTDDFMFGRFATGPDGHAERAEAQRDEKTTVEAEPTHSTEPFVVQLGDKTNVTSTVYPPGTRPVEAIQEAASAEFRDKLEVSRDTPTDDDRQPAKPIEKGAAMSVIDDMRVRQTSIRSELEEISSEHSGAVLTGEVRARWDDLSTEWQDLESRCQAEEERHAQLVAMAGDDKHEEAGAPQATQERFGRTAGGTGTYVTRRDARDKTPENVFDMAAYHNRSESQEQMMRLFGDGARRAIETFHYSHPDADRERTNAHIERILNDDPGRALAQRLLATGSDVYRSAFWKKATGGNLTAEEQRALAVGATGTGGAAVPPQIDPTLIPTANLSINPLRGIGRVFTTTSNIWKGVTSGGITAQYRAEAALMTDNSPTLTQPQLQPERADAFVPFSWELGQDWGTLETNLASELQDAKDQLEAVKFAVGAGHASNEPQGILTGAGTLVTTVLGTAFAVADIYALEAALPQRHIPNASWVATTGMFQKVRQFDTAGGANLWVQLQAQNPPELIGYPAYKATNVGTAGPALTATAIWGVFGDFNKFAIVDRVGMSVRFIENLFATSSSTAQVTVPTGQSGVVAFWRNTSGVLDSNAFRVGTISTSH